MSAENRLVVQAKELARRSWTQFGVPLIPNPLPGRTIYSYSEVNPNMKIFTDLRSVGIFVGIGLNRVFIEVSKTPNILRIDPLNALEIHTDLLVGINNRVFYYPLEIGLYDAVQMLGIEYKSGSIIDRFRLDLAGSFGDRSNKKYKG